MNTLTLFTPSVFRRLPFDLVDHLLTDSPNETSSSYPFTNMIEEDDKFRLELALPGYSREQISINYLKNVLTIKSNPDVTDGDERKYITREFSLRSFTKQFLLPRSLEVENIAAEFKDGILLVTIPKREEAKVKEPIEVQVQ